MTTRGPQKVKLLTEPVETSQFVLTTYYDVSITLRLAKNI